MVGRGKRDAGAKLKAKCQSVEISLQLAVAACYLPHPAPLPYNYVGSTAFLHPSPISHILIIIIFNVSSRRNSCERKKKFLLHRIYILCIYVLV